MEVKEVIIAAILAMAGGAGGAALINALHDRWKFNAERKAKKEDKAEEQQNKTESLDKEMDSVHDEIKTIVETLNYIKEGQMLVMLDRIVYLGGIYIKRGDITFEERKRIRKMHDCYHNKLGGNGDCKLIMEAIDELPLTK